MCQLTWLRLQIPLGALFLVYMLVDVITVSNVVHSHFTGADQFRFVCVERAAAIARLSIVDKVFARTVLDACLRRWTTVEWH
jgi:hypothetical protein